MELSRRHEVVAVDINAVQVAYAKDRASGAPPLPGAAERVLGRLRALAPLVGWRSSRLREFLDLEDPAEQIVFWRRHLDGPGFRAATDAIFSRFLLRAVYARSFLRRLPRQFGKVMRDRLKRGFARHANRGNPYARALLLGETSRAPAPPEAGRIRFVHSDAAAYLERERPGSFDGFALSNVLDGARDDYRERLLAAVERAAAPAAIVVLRSFSEPTGPSEPNLALEDRAMLWGTVEVKPAGSL